MANTTPAISTQREATAFASAKEDVSDEVTEPEPHSLLPTVARPASCATVTVTRPAAVAVAVANAIPLTRRRSNAIERQATMAGIMTSVIHKTDGDAAASSYPRDPE